MSSTQLNHQLEQEFINLITNLFVRQTSTCVAILGRRESGKTDFSLLIDEILEMTGVIHNFASNIRIFESPFEIKRLTNLQDLEFWAANTQGRKLFILDEAGKSLRRRTPMARLNIKLLDNLQILRKYKLSLIIIAPDSKYVDSAALGSDVLDAVFYKYYKNQKVALYEDKMEGYRTTIKGIPATSIKYDTWDVAPFKEHGETVKPVFKDRDLEVVWEWSHGKSSKDLGLHPMQLNRIIRKFTKEVVERDPHISH